MIVPLQQQEAVLRQLSDIDKNLSKEVIRFILI